MSVPKALSEAGLLSTAQVAKALSVHRSTVWLWISSGLLPHERVGPTKNFIGVLANELKAFTMKYPVHVANGSLSRTISKLSGAPQKKKPVSQSPGKRKRVRKKKEES